MTVRYAPGTAEAINGSSTRRRAISIAGAARKPPRKVELSDPGIIDRDEVKLAPVGVNQGEPAPLSPRGRYLVLGSRHKGKPKLSRRLTVPKASFNNPAFRLGLLPGRSSRTAGALTPASRFAAGTQTLKCYRARPSDS